MRRLALVLLAIYAFGGIVGQKVGIASASPTEAQVPHDASAKCMDGSWSSAQTSQGACSGHGGIKTWFGKPPKGATARCKDGTYSKSTTPQGTCSSHGGVAYAIGKGKK